jgi:ribosomal protein L7/L12
MSEKVTAMIEEIMALTVLELSELVHALEEEFVFRCCYGCSRRRRCRSRR